MSGQPSTDLVSVETRFKATTVWCRHDLHRPWVGGGATEWWSEPHFWDNEL